MLDESVICISAPPIHIVALLRVRMKTSAEDSTFPAIVSEVPRLSLAEAGMKKEAESGTKHSPLSAPVKAKGKFISDVVLN